MYCTRCGVELDEKSRYCSQCGHPTSRSLAQVPKPGEKKLYRPREGKKIGGVCAGFARYLDVDVSLMRITWLIVAVMTGVGFLAYLVAWIAMPKEPEPTAVMVQEAS